MVAVTFTHVAPPPGRHARSEEYYCKGWTFANDAIERYGVEACARMRKALTTVSSYEQGAADRWDDKPNRYGKGNT